MTPLRANDLFGPYVWIVALAFLSGFGGYLAFSGVTARSAPAPVAQWIAAPTAASDNERRI